MDSAERWRTNKSSITQRNVDKELLRIKSLGVVSVLNRTFEDEPRGRSRSTSHSSGSEDRELESVKLENEHQRELLRLQDALVDQLSEQIEYLLENNNQPQGDEIKSIRKELEDLGAEKETCEKEIQRVKERLEKNEIKMERMERLAEEMRQRYEDQQDSMKAKMEIMTQQLKEKDEVVNRLSLSLSRSSTFSERNEEDDQSVRSTSSSKQRRSYIARWKGNSLPPASPPPSTPLPPVPSDRRRSSASRLPVIAQKHMSVDAVGGPQSFSSIYEQEMYYKEFTDQLQQRLSVSKEIDDLSVWRPSDYDEIQRKIESEDWLEDQQKVAFWKGMKKKLKV
ncbi:hypothetical protein G6F56_005998 [Rhizopus delemar]|uniref:Uncharacterized protein n=1 Tax=Rhizopus stolonifer TaxID=4846 RepID=A0A367K088_RHIST|nr:hypothetical protein G6F56_005998 [Rhizopus delemar]RCH95613.1 hypothetical protein CU098_009718 [Rhizopus stolonifer]